MITSGSDIFRACLVCDRGHGPRPPRDQGRRARQAVQEWRAPRRAGPALATYDGRVIVIASLSKTVWGGLHLGWIRAPAATTQRLRAAALASGTAPSALDQVVATRLLPSLEGIIARRTRLLASNLEHLERRLRDIRGSQVTWHTPSGGVTLWLDLRAHSSHQVVQDCARRGVLLEPASSYAVGGRNDRHLRIPFTLPAPALDRVVDVLDQALGGGAR